MSKKQVFGACFLSLSCLYISVSAFLSFSLTHAPTHIFQWVVFLSILPVNRLPVHFTQTEFLDVKNIHISILSFLNLVDFLNHNDQETHVGPYNKCPRKWNLGKKTKNESVNIMVKLGSSAITLLEQKEDK